MASATWLSILAVDLGLDIRHAELLAAPSWDQFREAIRHKYYDFDESPEGAD